jgi:ribonuclease E
MEPVKMKAPMPQLDTPSAKHEDAEEKDSHEGDEIHDSFTDEPMAQEPEAPKAEVKTGGRKRRRAASSGIITA